MFPGPGEPLPGAGGDPQDDQSNPGRNPAEEHWEGSVNPQNAEDKAGKRTNKNGIGTEDNGQDSQPSTAEAERNVAPTSGNDTGGVEGEDRFQSRVGLGLNLKGRAKLLDRKKKIFLVILGLGTSAGIAALVAFMPAMLLRTLSNKLAEVFFDKVDYALDQRMDAYINSYVVNRTNFNGRCGTSVNKGCAFTPNSDSLFSVVAASWQQNRIEEKLFRKHGIEFERDLSDPTSRKIKVFKTNANGIRGEVGEFGERSIRKEIRGLFKEETKIREIVTRRHVRGILTKKYGATWCFIACAERDNIADIRLGAFERLKLKLVARISERLSARSTAYLLCAVSTCNKDALEKFNKELAEEVLQRADTEVMSKIANELADGTSRDLTEVIIKQLIEKVATRLGAQNAGRAAASAVPIAGQIYLAATIAEMAATLDDKIVDPDGPGPLLSELDQYLYESNIDGALNYAKNIETISDDVWSMESGIADSAAAFQLMNGAASSRLFGAMNGSNTEVKCKDGTVLRDDDPLVCPEKRAAQVSTITKLRNNEYADLIINMLFQYNNDYCPGVPFVDCKIRSIVRPVLQGINWTLENTLGTILSGAMAGIKKLPFIGGWIDSFGNFVTSQVGDFFGWLTKFVFSYAINPEAEDAEAFDQWAMGSNALAEQFMKGDPESDTGLGGILLSRSQETALNDAIQKNKMENLASKSLFERLFALDSSDSLLGQGTMAVASLTSEGAGSGISNFMNPIATLSDQYGSLLTTKASAAGQFGSELSRSNIFGIPSYGIPVDDASLSVDPLTTTPEVCSQLAQEREDSKVEYANGTVDYTKVNVCEIDSVISDAFTKKYDLDPEGTNTNTKINVTGLSCDGYQSVSAGGTTTNESYSSNISSNCEEVLKMCETGASDTEQILCEALKYGDVYYGNSYSEKWGTGEVQELYGFNQNVGNYGISAASWLSNRDSSGITPTNLLECSGLTSVALYDAYGVGSPGCSGNWTERNNPSLFKQINPEEIRPGDFLTKTFGCNSGGSGHIAIAASQVDAQGNIIVFETNSWGSPARFTEKNLDRDFPAGRSRYIGAGT